MGFLALVAVAVAGYIVFHNRKSVSVRMVVPFWGECECPHGGGMNVPFWGECECPHGGGMMYPSGESVSVRMVVV